VDPEREAKLKVLHDAIIKEQTVHDRKTATRFYEMLEKTTTPSKWRDRRSLSSTRRRKLHGT
jgi:hypothetical protein